MPSVTIDCFHEHLPPLAETCDVVAVDVIRATTTALTAAALGRRCFPVRSIEAAVPLAARLQDPLLGGELGGTKPYGFHVQNSPAEIARRDDVERPLILLSTSGTRLMAEAADERTTYLGTMRNHGALARHLAGRRQGASLLGAASRGEFREEDQICCARIATALSEAGWDTGSTLTEHVIERWRDAPDEELGSGASAEYLAVTGQGYDLDFILDHINDVDEVFTVEKGEVIGAPP